MEGALGVLTISDAAFERVVSVRATEPKPDALALWLEVVGVVGGEFSYDMYFSALDESGPADSVQEAGGLSWVVPADSIERLRGSILDIVDDGLVVKNPNTPKQIVHPDFSGADLTGDVAQRVIQLLEEQVNPSIAAHGGSAELVAIEGSVAFLSLGGGCQGCQMAKVTMSQGIQAAITEAIPEISSVVDVTDHANGTAPFFEPAK